MTNKAMDLILMLEGGEVDNPDDPGGHTNYGITQGTYDLFLQLVGRPHQSVSDITHSEVEHIYRTMYWDRARCDDLPADIALAHFAFAVHASVVQANKTLQRCVGVTADGIIGPKTLEAVQINGTHEDLLWHHALHYARIVARDDERTDGSDVEDFAPGWIARLMRIRDFIKERL